MKIKKILGYVLSIVGVIPYVLCLICGIDAWINGFSGICFISCDPEYGWEAMKGCMLFFSYLFWPFYIIGAILIIVGVILLIKVYKKSK